MKGLHLLSTYENGIQIYFYMLLCTCLLQLHLKQECVMTYDALNNTTEDNQEINDETNHDSEEPIETQLEGCQESSERATHLSDNNILLDNVENVENINFQSEIYPGLMINPQLLNGARGSTFLATIGSKLKRYWKTGVHWLSKLRDLLENPFNINNIDKLVKKLNIVFCSLYHLLI
jgi:hypothetical protein